MLGYFYTVIRVQNVLSKNSVSPTDGFHSIFVINMRRVPSSAVNQTKCSNLLCKVSQPLNGFFGISTRKTQDMSTVNINSG
jgi:hypothetical protein